ncbi:lamin tail domain-containing protein [Candidatus Kuenenbacteria bacterium]|nr:lamin tail domain-containing protein [Candidatus Kuenenbacteria bacterium]
MLSKNIKKIFLTLIILNIFLFTNSGISQAAFIVDPEMERELCEFVKNFGTIEQKLELNEYCKSILGAEWPELIKEPKIQKGEEPVILIPGFAGTCNWDLMVGQLLPDIFFNNWDFCPSVTNYNGIINSFEKSEFKKDQKLFVLYYDWRQKNNETYKNYLIPLIKKVKEQTGSEKIDIVAHSMGGLVARAYIESDDYQNDIDQLIILGTPNNGASNAYLPWQGGMVPEDWPKPPFYIYFKYLTTLHNTESFVQTIHNYIPSIRELLPIYDFLKNKKTEKIIPVSEMDEESVNVFLNELNKPENVEKLFKRTEVNIIAGVQENTLNNILVGEPKMFEGLVNIFIKWLKEKIGIQFENNFVSNNEVRQEILNANLCQKDYSSQKEFFNFANINTFSESNTTEECSLLINQGIENILSKWKNGEPDPINPPKTDINGDGEVLYDSATGEIGGLSSQAKIISLEKAKHQDLPDLAQKDIFDILGIKPPEVFSSSPQYNDEMVFFFASPVKVKIIAPDGKIITKEIKEIPNAEYQGTTDPNGVKMIYIPNPLPGEYKIELEATDNGEYHMFVDYTDKKTETTKSTMTYEKIIKDEKIEYTLSINNQQSTINNEDTSINNQQPTINNENNENQSLNLKKNKDEKPLKSGDVIINELMWSGSSSSTADEWIELRNTTNQEIDLSNFNLTYLKDEKEESMLLIKSGKISPNGFFLISNNSKDYQFTNGQSILNIDPDLIDSNVTFSNSNLQIKLYDRNFQDQKAILLDEAGDGKIPLAGKNETNEKISMERNEKIEDGKIIYSWHSATTQTNLDLETKDKATPNAINNQQLTDNNKENEKELAMAVIPQPTTGVVINEIVSNPLENEKEWIELYNFTDQEIDINGWTIEEGSGAKITLTGVIKAKDFLIIEDPKGSLNNDGDIIILKNKDGFLLDQVIYGQVQWKNENIFNNAPLPKQGQSIIRFPDGQDTNINKDDWQITITPTKKQENKKTQEQKNNENTPPISYGSYSTPVYSNQIIINEILPDPKGNDTEEWIEFFNQGDQDINLTNWILDDDENGSAKYIIPLNTIILKQGYLIFKRKQTGIILNNDKDRARLFDPNNQLKSEIFYQNAKSGQSYSRMENGKWEWVNPSPGAINNQQLTDNNETQNSKLKTQNQNENENLKTEEENNKSINNQQSTINNEIKKQENIKTINNQQLINNNEEKEQKNNKILNLKSLKEVRKLEKGAIVKVKGVVSCVPGILGSQIFYLAGSGIQVYLFNKDFPELNLGDEIEIQGELSSYQNEARINLSSKNEIKILQKNQSIHLEEIKINEINENTEGYLIKVKGEVIETSGDTFYVADDSMACLKNKTLNSKCGIKVYIKESTKIEKPRMQKGDQVEVTGIVSQLGEEYRILPRMQEDIKIINNQQLTINNEDKSIGNQQSTINNEDKSISNQQLTVNNEEKSINNQQSTINNKENIEKQKQEEKKSEAEKTAATAGLGASAALAAIYRRQIILFLTKLFFKS